MALRKNNEQNQEDAIIAFEKGNLYEEGNEVVEKDEKKSFAYYQKAADLGHKEAQCKLAYMYQKGLGIKQDLNQSFKYYKLAADQEEGHPIAQYNVALMYEEGNGIEK